MQISEETPVVVIGAGLGGLTLALALRKLGLPCLVLERQPKLSEVGAGITLWENALKVLERVGAIEAVRSVSQPSESGMIGTLDGKTLVRAALVESSPLGRLWAAHRVELQEALYRLLPEGTVRFGATFEDWQERDSHVSLRLSDGEALRTPLVVGADGLRSNVRRRLFGDEPLRYAGYAAYRGVCPKPAGYSGPLGEFFGCGMRFGVVEISKERLYWYAVLSQPLGTPRAPSARAFLEARFASYAFDTPRIIAATPETAILYHELFDRPPAPRLYRGRITLLGDAAHPTTPNMGQGAAMAMESALILARALAESESMEAALTSYQQHRSARTARVTKTSRSIGRLAQLKNPLLRALRDLVFRAMPERARMAQLEWVACYDAASASLRYSSRHSR